jgi:hypothetical protein
MDHNKTICIAICVRKIINFWLLREVKIQLCLRLIKFYVMGDIQ